MLAQLQRARFNYRAIRTEPQRGSRRGSVLVNAIWNWEYVDNSADLGVKNTGYAVGLLRFRTSS